MTDKKKKYQPEPEDHKPMKTGNRKRLNRQMFVARIVNTENQALTAKEVHSLLNMKVEPNRGRTQIQTQANLADAVKASLLDKTRIQVSDTRTQVVYHPTTMKPMGIDIPIPAHTRSKKPDAVKVAEKVLADLGASDDGIDLDDFIPPHTKHTPIDKDMFNTLAEKHKSEGLIGGKKDKDAVVSTIQHHFTAEQLLDTLNNLNPDLHDDVIVAVFDALGKNNYSPFHHDYTKPQPRKTALLSWAFVSGNLVVKE